MEVMISDHLKDIRPGTKGFVVSDNSLAIVYFKSIFIPTAQNVAKNKNLKVGQLAVMFETVGLDEQFVIGACNQSEFHLNFTEANQAWKNARLEMLEIAPGILPPKPTSRYSPEGMIYQ